MFPRVYQASATVERQLPLGFVLVSDYTYQRGTIFFAPATSMRHCPPPACCRIPTEGNIGQIESSATSRGNISQLDAKKPSESAGSSSSRSTRCRGSTTTRAQPSRRRPA